jgi:hypothetical protein
VQSKVYHVNASRADTTSASHTFGCSALRRLLPTPAAPCAAGYAWGEDGSNQCPASYYAIDTEAACESAATAAGKAYRGSVTDPSYPRGCFFTRGDNNALTLNADAVGTGEPGLQLLCSGAARVSPGRYTHCAG